MNDDVFDKDLMKELGLDEDDIATTKKPGAKNLSQSPLKKKPLQTKEPLKNPSQESETNFNPESSLSRKPQGPSVTAQKTAGAMSQSHSQITKPAATVQDKLKAKFEGQGQPQSHVGESSSNIAKKPMASQQTNIVAQDVPVQLVAVMAKQSVKLKDVVKLKAGEIIDFKKSTQDPIDLVANGKLIAKAELVTIDGKLGLRILQMMK